MKNIAAILAALALLAAIPVPALAEEAAKYNFATAQGAKDLKITPGGVGTGVIYFYNIDGNRITHVSLETSETPEGWQVEIRPSLGQTLVEIGGSIVTVTENLYVEPSELLVEEPKNVPTGMVSIVVPGRGYAYAKAAEIVIHVPDSAQIGDKFDITVSALAEWLGQTGAAAIKQARDFTFTVEVSTQSSGGGEIIVDDNGFSAFIGKWLPTIIAIVIVAVAAVLITLRTKKRREKV